MNRQNYSSGAIWEDKVGYSRAVRIGNVVEFSGTTAVSEDGLVGIGDAHAQTCFILEKIKLFLEEMGASLNDVIRTRIFLTDITKWKEVGRAHNEYFSEIKPVTSMVEISALIDPQMLVEIEVSAILSNS
jgi:enamine deaminase RidA (YjgF/YER057c/UK114 family)